MLKNYFIVGDKLLCMIPRTGSTSLLRLIEDKYYPEMKNVNIALHFKIPSIIDDNKRELVAMFRHPVERFISGCSQTKRTINEGIEELKTKSLDRIDFHLRPQYTFLSEKRSTKFFKFPEQLNECANYLELPTPISHLNASKSKSVPSLEQLTWLNKYYEKDFEIFNSLYL